MSVSNNAARHKNDSDPLTLLNARVRVATDKGSYTLVEQAFTDKDSPKAQCFKKTYRGINTKVPPFLPFVIQMTMRG